MDVGEQFMKARSASCSASDGEGAPKEKLLEKSVVMVVCDVEQVLCGGRKIPVEVVEVQQLPYNGMRMGMVIRRQ